MNKIQERFIPHMEVMQRHIQTVKDLVKDHRLSIVDNMVNLVAKIEIEK